MTNKAKRTVIWRNPPMHFTFSIAMSLTIAAITTLGAAPGKAETTKAETTKAETAKAETAKADHTTNPVQLSEAEQPANWTPVLMSTTGNLQPFRGSEGLWNIVYEIELASYLPDPILMDSIEVLDGTDQKRVLIKLSGKDLDAVMLSPSTARKKASHTAIGAGGLAIAFINLTFKGKDEIPSTIVHRIKYHTTSGKEANKEETTVSTLRRINGEPPLVISPPLDGGRWMAAGGYSGKLGHRRAIFPIDNHLVLSQRYAIDWVRLDDTDHTSHSATKVEDFACYGQPIYAVADGKIVGVVDHFPNQTPPQPSGNKYYAGGNIVVLEIGKDLYAFYAHCKPGSILVKDGDMVKRGQQIAQVGNTGNSTGPHLHMHITTGPKPLGSMSVPYVFDSFEVVGEVENIDQFADNDEHGKKQTFKAISEHSPRHNELVKEGHIVTFKVQKAEAKK